MTNRLVGHKWKRDATLIDGECTVTHLRVEGELPSVGGGGRLLFLHSPNCNRIHSTFILSPFSSVIRRTDRVRTSAKPYESSERLSE